MVAEYGLGNQKIVCITDSDAKIVLACRLIGNKRIPCIAHKTNSLIQKDLMTHDSSKTLRDLLKKVRAGQNKLLYRHEEMKAMRIEDNQKTMALFLSEIAEIEQAIDADSQFADTDYDPTRFENDFTGLKSISEIRWSCVYMLSKCYLDNSSE